MLKKMWDFILKFLFGDDIFISYARADGGNYATGLANELVNENFSCKFDAWGTESSKVIPNSLKNSLKRCSVLVVVGTEAAAQNKNIKTELEIFGNTGRPIIPIIFDGVRLNEDKYCDTGNLQTPESDPDKATALNSNIPTGKAIWADSISGQSISCELNEALESGNPTKAIVGRISKSYTFSRKDQRLKKASMAASTGLLLLVAVSAGAAMFASYKTTEASIAVEKADKANQSAQEALTSANQAKRDAKTQQEIAVKKTKEATDATKAAERASNQAEMEKRNATNQKRIADTEKIKAERASIQAAAQTKIADAKTSEAIAASKVAKEETDKAIRARKARDLGLSALSRTYYMNSQSSAADNPLESIHWIQKVFENVPQNDENVGLYRLWGLNLITAETPKLVINNGEIISSQGNIAITVSKYEDLDWNEFHVWNLRTGETVFDPTKGHGCQLLNIVISPNGEYIAAETMVGEDVAYHFHVWHAKNGKEIIDFGSDSFLDHERGERNFEFSPDSRAIIFESWDTDTDDVVIKVLGIDDEKTRELKSQKKSFHPNNLKNSVPVSSDPEHSLIITYKKIEDQKEVAVIEDLFTGEIKGKILVPENLEFIDFIGRGNRLVVVHTDKETKKRIVTAYDVAPDDIERRHYFIPSVKPTWFADKSEREFLILGFSADGNRLIVKTENGNDLIFWNLDQGGIEYWRMRLSGRHKILHASFINNEKQVVIISNESLSTDRNRKQVIEIVDVEKKNRIYSKSMNGALKISSTNDSFFQSVGNTINVWNIKTKDEKSVRKLLNVKLDLEKNECLVSATAVPEENAVITFSRNPCNQVRFEKVSMQRWDLSTGKTQWNLPEGVEIRLGRKILQYRFESTVIFSRTGKKFATLIDNNSGNSSKSLFIWDTETGKSIVGIPPSTGKISAAWFDDTESKINTFEYGKDRTYTINQIDLSTTEVVAVKKVKWGPGQSYGMTKNGKNLISVSLDSYINEGTVTIRSLENESLDNRHSFRGTNTANFAANLLSSADEVSLTAKNRTSLEFTDRFMIQLDRSGEILLENKRDGLKRIYAPEESSSEKLNFSHDGNLILFLRRNGINFYTSKAVMPSVEIHPANEFYDSQFIFATFLSEPNRVLTIDETGGVRTMLIDFAKEKAFWVEEMGKALSGKELTDGFLFRNAPQENYLITRKRYIETLKAKSADGDWDARFILDNWSPEN